MRKIINQFRIQKYLVLVISCLGLSIHAAGFTSLQRSSTTTPSKVSILSRQFYTTLGWHDGGRMASFFVPLDLQANKSCIWIDTGGILQGAAVGYRRFLTENYFLGVYCGYDVMTETLPLLSGLAVFDVLSSPVRMNLGGEFSHERVGQLTLNVYGNVYNPGQYLKANDYFGTSAKLALHHFPFSLFNKIKPFIGAAHARVGLWQNNWKPENLCSAIIGAKFIVNRWMDWELKYVYDVKQHQYPLHIGLQIKFDRVHPCVDYFRYKFKRPADRYIPHYQSSVQLEGSKTNVRNTQVSQENASVMYQTASAKTQNEQSKSPGSNKQNKVNTLWLNDSTQIKVANNVFSLKQCQRADELARLNGVDNVKKVPINHLWASTDNVQIELKSGVPEEELRVLWNNPNIPKKAILTMQDSIGEGLGVGLLGSPASFLYGVRCVVKQVAEAALVACAENIAFARIIQKMPQGRTKTMFLVGSPTGIKAEQRAIRHKQLADA